MQQIRDLHTFFSQLLPPFEPRCHFFLSSPLPTRVICPFALHLLLLCPSCASSTEMCTHHSLCHMLAHLCTQSVQNMKRGGSGDPPGLTRRPPVLALGMCKVFHYGVLGCTEFCAICCTVLDCVALWCTVDSSVESCVALKYVH